MSLFVASRSAFRAAAPLKRVSSELLLCVLPFRIGLPWES